MKNNVIYPIIVGVMLTLFGVLGVRFFPESPADGVNIQYSHIEMPVDFFRGLIRGALKSQSPIDDEKLDRDIRTIFGYNSDITVNKYTIRNDKSIQLKDLRSKIGNSMLVYLSDDKGTSSAYPADKYVDITLLPNHVSTLYVLSDQRFYFGNNGETFLLGDINVPLNSITIDDYNLAQQFAEFFNEHWIVGIALLYFSAMCMAIIVIGLVIYIIFGNNVPYHAKNTGEKQLGIYLAAINYLKEHDIRRFRRVVKAGEVAHARWTKAQDEPAANRQ